MLLRIKQQGLDITPRILIVITKLQLLLSIISVTNLVVGYANQKALLMNPSFSVFQVTRLLPDAVGTTCGERLEQVDGTQHTSILRVPFRNEKGILRKWISRFDVWPYLETYTEVNVSLASRADLKLMAC